MLGSRRNPLSALHMRLMILIALCAALEALLRMGYEPVFAAAAVCVAAFGTTLFGCRLFPTWSEHTRSVTVVIVAVIVIAGGVPSADLACLLLMLAAIWQMIWLVRSRAVARPGQVAEA
ncbi:hypothetical protein Rhe02_39200 [Rhizocola hellebori]|uniref:Uncharacterized protein n=1 Tax=Rhizocola hellebori TaxID=1392758 RepID=A0A8J3Q818_9ACTN|nr:hypothetical protein [Rhizocola hellebori]GIH05853.1 hypothetical protein Rhe02_39200 [Rhizocola hellebori]